MLGRIFSRPREPRHGLHVCRDCGEPYVHPVEFGPAGVGRVRIVTRCGACCAWSGCVTSLQEADALADECLKGREEIRAALEQAERERMIVDARVLAIALANDLIDAGDFQA